MSWGSLSLFFFPTPMSGFLDKSRPGYRRHLGRAKGSPTGGQKGQALINLYSSQYRGRDLSSLGIRSFLGPCWACLSWEAQDTQDLAHPSGTCLRDQELEVATKCYWET